MAETKITITPSPEARQLYSRMVALADDRFVLDLPQALALSCARLRAGQEPQAVPEVTELVQSDWIAERQDGTWDLSPAD